MSRLFEIGLDGDRSHAVEVARHGDSATLTIDGRNYHGSLRPAGDGYELTLEDRTERIWTYVSGDTVWLHGFGVCWAMSVIDPEKNLATAALSGDLASAPMPGTMINVGVEPGDAVAAGQTLVVIESMKMQSEIIAERDGVVDRVFVAVGETFDRGAPLVSLELIAEPEED